jgi:hypothetical protein
MKYSTKTTLEAVEPHLPSCHKARLVHTSAGIEPAGAGTRVRSSEAWGVIINNEDGTQGGRWFKTQAEATEAFASLKFRMGL